MTLDVAARLRQGSLDLDFACEVGEHEVVALLGPNGAGKTTLLKAIAGLAPIIDGHVRLDGDVLEDSATGIYVPTERRSIGFVFQDYLLFPHLSVLDNIAFGLRTRGQSRSAAAVTARDWLDRLGLTRYAGARPSALSGGERQRVALARALAPGPRVLLLDEPLAALDATTRVDVRHDLKRHLDAFGGYRVVVTHDALEAMTLADRLVVIENGRLVQSGTPEDVAQRPRSRYVADLVGVNLLRGQAEAGAVQIAGGPRVAVAGASSGEVFAVVHPRAVSIHLTKPEGSPRNVWSGRATGMELLGDRVRVRVEGAVPLVAEVTPAAVAELGLHTGGEVWTSFKATDVSVYPA